MKLDIFNEQYELLGKADGREVHAKGLWHRVFSCLIVTSRGTVLLQKKHSGLYAFERPDYVEPISVAGHYQAGEAVEDGVRETEEELGIRIDYGDLHPLGIRTTEAHIASNYVEREFQHLHLLPLDLRLEEYHLGNAEVSGLLEIEIDAGIALARGEVAQIPARHLHWERNATKGTLAETVLHRHELIPGYLEGDQFYLRMFVAARGYLDGGREDLRW